PIDRLAKDPRHRADRGPDPRAGADEERKNEVVRRDPRLADQAAKGRRPAKAAESGGGIAHGRGVLPRWPVKGNGGGFRRSFSTLPPADGRSEVGCRPPSFVRTGRCFAQTSLRIDQLETRSESIGRFLCANGR